MAEDWARQIGPEAQPIDHSIGKAPRTRSLEWCGQGRKGPSEMWIRVAMVRFRPKLAPAGKRPHARYGRPGPARIRVTPPSKLRHPVDQAHDWLPALILELTGGSLVKYPG